MILEEYEKYLHSKQTDKMNNNSVPEDNVSNRKSRRHLSFPNGINIDDIQSIINTPYPDNYTYEELNKVYKPSNDYNLEESLKNHLDGKYFAYQSKIDEGKFNTQPVLSDKEFENYMKLYKIYNKGIISNGHTPPSSLSKIYGLSDEELEKKRQSYNHPSKPPVDSDLTVSDNISTVPVLDTSPAAQAQYDRVGKTQSHNNIAGKTQSQNDNESEYNYDEIGTDEDSIINDISNSIKNIGRGAGKNIARYSKLANKGISKGLDILNPYTWVTGEKTGLSQWFDNAAQTNDYYLNKWNKDSAGSKAALAGEILLDPAVVLPSGVAQTGSKLARIGNSALAGAGQGAGLQYAKDYADGNDPYENIAMAGGLGGAVNAAIAGVTRGKAPNITGLADNYINEPYSLKKELNQIADEAVELYKKNVRPLTKAGRQKNINEEFMEYVNKGRLNKSIDDLVNDGIQELNNLDNIPAPSFNKIDDTLDVPVSNNISSVRNTELEKIADDYINENLKTLPKSNYKPLNAKNYDTVINELNKPEFRVLNNENIDDILRQDEELIANIANIRRKNRQQAKNKSLDEVISEYKYRDTTYLEKELNKSLKNMSKSDIYKKASELKANKSSYSVEEYNDLLKGYQQEMLNSPDGRKWQALKQEIKSRQNAPAPENYKSSYKPLTNAVNISGMQPKSTQPLINKYDDINNYDYRLPVIEDDVVDNVLDTSLPLNMTKDSSGITQLNLPNFSGKSSEIVDSSTGEILEIPAEILEIIKKKAQMTY